MEKDIKAELKAELATLTTGHWVIKTDAKNYEFHFNPIGCTCGGVVGIGHDFPSVETALYVAVQEARKIQEQGWHSHGGKKKTKNK